MGRLMIVAPLAINLVTPSRGTGGDNLVTPDPKEVWADTASGSAAKLTIDLGGPRVVDTIFLGHLGRPAAAATWSITGGLAASNETVIQATTALRVPDVAGSAPATSHAFWSGAALTVRYLALTLTQPAGSPPLTAGVLVVGRAFVSEKGQEWGAGRRPIDTGSVTPLPSGGFAVVEGARKRAFGWTFGDLTLDEADRLDLIAEACGSTRVALVVSDPDRTAGLRNRLHYGLFERWRAPERRNRVQTRWEVGLEEWV